MLKSLASYFLGGDEASSNDEEPIAIKSFDAEDDWVYVDVSSEDAGAQKGCVAVPQHLPPPAPNPTILSRPPAVSVHASSPSSQPQQLSLSLAVVLSPTASPRAPLSPQAMEGSWFLTPPPCFTIQNPTSVETSPLENLLIEHPSMSVYHHAPTSEPLPLVQARAVLAPAKEEEEEEEEEKKVVAVSLGSRSEEKKQDRSRHQKSRKRGEALPPSQRQGVVGSGDAETMQPTVTPPAVIPRHARPHRVPSNLGSLQAALLQQVKQETAELRASQQVAQIQLQRHLKRGQMTRSNRAREVSARGNRRPRRSDLMHFHSGMNNNRKC